jgi:hypothetical protein
LLSYLNSCFKNFKYISFIFLYIFFFSFSVQILANEQNKNLENVYKLLQEKNFKGGLKELQILCEDNNIQAQLLFSKILFSGDLTPQDFENSYFWSSSALLGGLKKSEIIIEKLNNYLTEDKIV